jgi:hypothetical protein
MRKNVVQLGAAVTLLGAGAACLMGMFSIGAASAAADKRSYAAASFAMSLDGQGIGYVKSVEGGGIVADVVVERAAQAKVLQKHISVPRYEPFVVKVGLDSPVALYEWIDASWTATQGAKSLSVVECATDGRALSERAINDGLLTEVGFPALDGRNNKEVAYLTLKISPANTRTVAAKGNCAVPKLGAKTKQWTSANFSLMLDGVDASGVVRVEPFSVTVGLGAPVAGTVRGAGHEAVSVDIPSLELTVARTGARDFEAWFEKFVVQGNSGAGQEKGGALVLLGADLKEELARVTLQGVGISSMRPDKTEPGHVNFGLYVESMRFSVGGAKPKAVGASAMKVAAPKPKAKAK